MSFNDDATPDDFIPGGGVAIGEVIVRFLLERHNGTGIPVVDKTYLKSIVLNSEQLTWLPNGLYTLKGPADAISRLVFNPFDLLSREEIKILTERRSGLEQMPSMTVDTLNRLVIVVQELRARSGPTSDKWWLKSVAGLLRKNGVSNISDYTLKNGYFKSRVFKETLAFERYRMQPNLIFDTSKLELEVRGRQLLAVAESTVGGLGLFAKKRLEKSLLICAYSGNVISTEEARKLLSRGNDSIVDLPSLNCAINGMPGIIPFFIGRYMNHAGTNTKAHNVMAELTTYQKLSRYIPDGSDSNPLLPPLTDEDLSNKTDLTIAFFAKHDIQLGEELFWDYVEGLEPYVSS